MKIIGSKLREARKSFGFTVESIAKAADLTTRRIWQIETDEESNLNRNAVEAICKRIGITPESLT